MGTFVGSMFVLPFFLQNYRQLNPKMSGLTTFPQALGFILAARFVGVAYLKVGPRRLIVAGLLITALINSVFLTVDDSTSLWWIRLVVFARGMCLPLMFIPLQTSTLAQISMADTGRATSISSTQQKVTSAIGTAVIAGVMFGGLRSKVGAAVAAGGDEVARRSAELSAYRTAFTWIVVLYLIGAVLALLVRDRDAEATMTRKTGDVPAEPALVKD